MSKIAEDVDTGKVVQMCAFHDVSESRISDLNYVHQKYTERYEEKAHKDLTRILPFGDDLKGLLDEYEERQTRESQLAKDADILELILSLKEQMDIGNERAKTWLPSVTKRLLIEEGRMLSKKILETDSDRWWFSNKDDKWWVTRKEK